MAAPISKAVVTQPLSILSFLSLVNEHPSTSSPTRADDSTDEKKQSVHDADCDLTSDGQLHTSAKVAQAASNTAISNSSHNGSRFNNLSAYSDFFCKRVFAKAQDHAQDDEDVRFQDCLRQLTEPAIAFRCMVGWKDLRTRIKVGRDVGMGTNIAQGLVDFTELDTLTLTSFNDMPLSGLKLLKVKHLVFRTPIDSVKIEGNLPDTIIDRLCTRLSLRELVQVSPNLESLDIGRNHRVGTTRQQNIHMSISEDLGLEETEEQIDEPNEAIQMIAKLTHLKALTLHENQCNGLNLTVPVIEALAPLKELRCLHLLGVSPSPTIHKVGLLTLAQFPQLTSFGFEVPTLASDFDRMSQVYSVLPQMKHLTELIIQDPQPYHVLLDHVTKCPKLERLKITHVVVSSDGLSASMRKAVEKLTQNKLWSFIISCEPGYSKETVDEQLTQLRKKSRDLCTTHLVEKEIAVFKFDPPEF